VRFTHRRAAAALIAALALSCREKPAPAAESPRSSLTASSQPSLPPGHPAVDAAPPVAGAVDTGSISGTIAVAPSLQGRATGGVLFVIARSGASKQIVAVRREEAARFPFAFRISGADAMIAGTAFSGPLDLTARLSKSGDAVAAKGDVEGVVRGVNVGASDVVLTLDTVHE
jgi:hypothetical protein